MVAAYGPRPCPPLRRASPDTAMKRDSDRDVHRTLLIVDALVNEDPRDALPKHRLRIGRVAVPAPVTVAARHPQLRACIEPAREWLFPLPTPGLSRRDDSDKRLRETQPSRPRVPQCERVVPPELEPSLLACLPDVTDFPGDRARLTSKRSRGFRGGAPDEHHPHDRRDGNSQTTPKLVHQSPNDGAERASAPRSTHRRPHDADPRVPVLRAAHRSPDPSDVPRVFANPAGA